mmetsp:Transcript_5518/g.10931  ORF Transcript_5518/g.10931 Transcript_5518/m.10931 type:complete len:81 (+) Transcript_5518:951-1193(+)
MKAHDGDYRLSALSNHGPYSYNACSDNSSPEVCVLHIQNRLSPCVMARSSACGKDQHSYPSKKYAKERHCSELPRLSRIA